MRRPVLFFVLACACNVDLGSVAGFDIPYDIPDQTVPGNAVANSAGVVVAVTLPAFPINIDVVQEAQANGVSGAVSTVELTSMSFTMDAASSTCFDFIQDLSITISSTKPGTTLAPVVIASGSNPGCVTTWNLTPSNVNIKPYLDEGAQATPAGQGIPPASDETFDGHIVAHASL
jgi:hypothetical protein